MWIQSKNKIRQFSFKACTNQSMMGKTAKYNSKFSKLKISCHHLPENANGLQGYQNNAIYHEAFAVCKNYLNMSLTYS